MIKCKICKQEFKNNLGGNLTVHLKQVHNLSYEDYYVITELDSVEPKCKCGYCNERPNFYRGKFKNYAIGHNKFDWIEEQYIIKYGQPKCNNDGCDGLVKFHRGIPNKYCSPTCQGDKWNQKKVKITVKEKYGVDNVFQLNEIKEKSKETMLEKYGVEHVMLLNKYQKIREQTYINRYGAKHPMLVDMFKTKHSNTSLKNYGVTHYSKTDKFRPIASKNMCKYNSNIHTNHKIKTYKETKLYYQSLYELRFLEMCEKLNLLKEIHNSPRFYFLDSNKYHLPDFKFRENYIIEIKSTYWMNRQGGIDLINKKKKSVENKGYKYIFCLDENNEDFMKII